MCVSLENLMVQEIPRGHRSYLSEAICQSIWYRRTWSRRTPAHSYTRKAVLMDKDIDACHSHRLLSHVLSVVRKILHWSFGNSECFQFRWWLNSYTVDAINSRTLLEWQQEKCAWRSASLQLEVEMSSSWWQHWWCLGRSEWWTLYWVLIRWNEWFK